MSKNTTIPEVSSAIKEVEVASQAIIDAAGRLDEVGKTIDSSQESLERELLLKLHKRVSTAKDLTAKLDYIEPSSTSCSC